VDQPELWSVSNVFKRAKWLQLTSR
jgi:hypothetical protein